MKGEGWKGKKRCPFCGKVCGNVASLGMHIKGTHPKKWKPSEDAVRRKAARNGAGRPQGSTAPEHPYKEFMKGVKGMARYAGIVAQLAPLISKEMDAMRDDNRALRVGIDKIAATVTTAAAREKTRGTST